MRIETFAIIVINRGSACIEQNRGSFYERESLGHDLHETVPIGIRDE